LKKEKPERNIKITHHLANGEIRDSMKGYMVPVNEKTEIFYNLLASYNPPKKNKGDGTA
jgi:hypothetical protein